MLRRRKKRSKASKPYPVRSLEGLPACKQSAAPSPIRLTDEQELAFSKIRTFVQNKDSTFYLLMGFAGTGKSTLCTETIRRLADVRFTLTAPTNKAVRVLREMAERSGCSIKCRTIHSLLSLMPVQEETEVRLQTGNSPDLSSLDVIIVDECSMINRELISHIQRIPHLHATKIVFMGDPAQLPPVKEGLSPAFSCSERSQLNGIVRQKAGNPIIDLTCVIRQHIESQASPLPTIVGNNNGKEGVFCTKDEHLWETWIKETFQKEHSEQNPTAIRILTWSNRRVARLNHMIQQQEYGESDRPFHHGQRVILTSPVFINPHLQSKTIILSTDDECTVVGMEADQCEGVRLWRVILQRGDGQKGTACVCHTDDMDLQVETQKHLHSEARTNPLRWNKYYRFINTFNRLQAVYAMTVHRSQGSTFDTVFVDIPHILQNPNLREAYQMLYVAVSRASKAVVLLQ